MPALHHEDGSVSVKLYDYPDGESPKLVVDREFTKDEWAKLRVEADAANTTRFELLRNQAKAG